jgi:hypothetical protein
MQKRMVANKKVTVRCLNSGSAHTSWLEGCIGEVSQEKLTKFERQLKRVKKSGFNPKLNVSFPVSGYFDNVGLYPGWKTPTNFIKLTKKEFIKTEEIPVSLYKRVPLCTAKTALKNIVDRATLEGEYISSHRKDDLFKGILGEYIEKFGEGLKPFVWKKESGGNNTNRVFMELRVYPLDVIVSPCPRYIKGFILCIYTRAVDNFYSERMLEDVFILSSEDDYINYLDGDDKKRETIPVNYLKEKYGKTLTVAELLEKIKNGELNQRKIKKEDKNICAE